MAGKLIVINIAIIINAMNFENILDKPIIPIGRAAEILNVSVPTLRMYEKEGLILSAKSSGNQRLYSKSDLERIICIRKTINEKKISIPGIKAIYSLIPCWTLIPCTTEERNNCQHFLTESVLEPCWMLNKKDKKCLDTDCRECIVYKDYSTCIKIKSSIKVQAEK